MLSLLLFLLGILALSWLWSWLIGSHHSDGPVIEAMVWEDINCNGQFDSGEQPLSGVCVWPADDLSGEVPSTVYCESHGATQEGHWRFGCSSSCRYAYVLVPGGLEPTTDTIVEFSAARYELVPVSFGMAPVSICPEKRIVTPTVLRNRQMLCTLGVCLVLLAVVGITLAVITLWRRKGEGEEQGPA